MKKCSTCGCDKPLDEFGKNPTKKDGYNYVCKECHKAYLKKHYANNKDYYKKKARNRESKIIEWFIQYKSKLECINCGENHFACLDFHHTKEKEKEIADAIGNGWTKERLLKEISKCDVLCANCHRKRHYEERTGSFRFRSI